MNDIKLHHIDFYDIPEEEVQVRWEPTFGYVVYVDIKNSDKKLRIVIPKALNKAIAKEVRMAMLGD